MDTHTNTHKTTAVCPQGSAHRGIKIIKLETLLSLSVMFYNAIVQNKNIDLGYDVITSAFMEYWGVSLS